MSESIKKIVQGYEDVDTQIRKRLDLASCYPLEPRLSDVWCLLQNSVIFAKKEEDFQKGLWYEEERVDEPHKSEGVVAVLTRSCTGQGKIYILFDKEFENPELKQRYENGEF